MKMHCRIFCFPNVQYLILVKSGSYKISSTNPSLVCKKYYDSFPFKSFDHVTLFIKPEVAVFTHVTRYRLLSLESFGFFLKKILFYPLVFLEEFILNTNYLKIIYLMVANKKMIK